MENEAWLKKITESLGITTDDGGADDVDDGDGSNGCDGGNDVLVIDMITGTDDDYGLQNRQNHGNGSMANGNVVWGGFINGQKYVHTYCG